MFAGNNQVKFLFLSSYCHRYWFLIPWRYSFYLTFFLLFGFSSCRWLNFLLCRLSYASNQITIKSFSFKFRFWVLLQLFSWLHFLLWIQLLLFSLSHRLGWLILKLNRVIKAYLFTINNLLMHQLYPLCRYSCHRHTNFIELMASGKSVNDSKNISKFLQILIVEPSETLVQILPNS